MSTLVAMRALLFAGECFAASVFLLAVAWAANAFLKQAAMRHVVWLTAFGVLLVLPAIALIVPAKIVIARKSETPAPTPVYVQVPDRAIVQDCRTCRDRAGIFVCIHIRGGADITVVEHRHARRADRLVCTLAHGLFVCDGARRPCAGWPELPAPRQPPAYARLR
ncbi:MAG: hypothetical protein WDM89_13655 [Rhizomicrobium sp.]